MKHPIVIAIDGTSASGKSTNAKLVAKALGFTYVDTGAMYRTLAWYCLQQKVDVENGKAVAAACRKWKTKLECVDGKVRLLVDGYYPEKEMRTEAVSGTVSHVATVPQVRKWMKLTQRDCIQFGNLVMEGRDIGTNVFPETDYKFYLDAHIEERSKRRAAEGVNENLAARDQRDSQRAAAPLMIALGAKVINNSAMTSEQTSGIIIADIQRRGWANLDEMNATDERPAVPPIAETLDAWLTPGRFALVLAALIAAFFPDVLFAGKSFVFRDFGIFIYPFAHYQRECFWAGEMPLWDPLNNCGIPFLAQWNIGALYPPSLIYILLPLNRGINLFMLLHLFWAGFGMYRLAGHWTGSRLAGAVAGVAFAFNGLTLNCLMVTSNIAALAWMPWVILLVERSWSGNRRWVIVAAFAGALQMLAGVPEMILFTWLILSALWVGQLVTNKELRLQVLLRFVAVIALVTLLCAVQLLPFLDLLAHSQRSSGMRETSWPIPSWGWVNLLVPLFHCYRSPAGVYFQPGQDWASSYYPGIGALALGLLAAVMVRQPRVWLLLAAAVLGFLTAQGDHGPLYGGLLKAFPFLGFMRYPIKFAFLLTLALPLLAAYGVAWLQRTASGQSVKARGAALGLGFLLSGLVAAIIWYARTTPFPGEQWPLILSNGLTRIMFLNLTLTALLVYPLVRRQRLQVTMGLLVLSLVWLDAITHAPRPNPTVDASAFEPNLLPRELKIAPRLGEGRAFLNKPTHDRVYGWMLADTYKDYVGRRVTLLGNCNLLDGIPVTHGFFSTYLREQQELYSNFFVIATNELPRGLADFLSISYVSNPTNFAAWQPRASALPYCTVGQKPVFVEAAQIPGLLFQPDFDPREVVYLPTEARGLVSVTNGTKGTVRMVNFAAQQMEFEVEAAAPALAVISQTYYHPWQAYVDGKPIPLWKANHAFQAVEVPAGKHTLKLVYEDRRFQAGAIISTLTLLGCLGCLMRPKFLRL